MNTELVRAVFDCGIDDLRLLDDAECDMYAVIGRMREESIYLPSSNTCWMMLFIVSSMLSSRILPITAYISHSASSSRCLKKADIFLPRRERKR